MIEPKPGWVVERIVDPKTWEIKRVMRCWLWRCEIVEVRTLPQMPLPKYLLTEYKYNAK